MAYGTGFASERKEGGEEAQARKREGRATKGGSLREERKQGLGACSSWGREEEEGKPKQGRKEGKEAEEQASWGREEGESKPKRKPIERAWGACCKDKKKGRKPKLPPLIGRV